MNAADDAAWAEENDDELGRSFWFSRRRGSGGLATALTVKLAPPIAATPRSTARMVTPLRLASAAATANHSRLWFAARVSPFRPPSAGEGGMAALRRTSSRSTRLISCATRRHQSSTRAA
jgi:hypothetical protein